MAVILAVDLDSIRFVVQGRRIVLFEDSRDESPNRLGSAPMNDCKGSYDDFMFR